uniref:Uncharacterized protein n=1 Tax=Syphacia muris TaxID=451379 RepID=A0A0N5ANF6_9BILA
MICQEETRKSGGEMGKKKESDAKDGRKEKKMTTSFVRCGQRQDRFNLLVVAEAEAEVSESQTEFNELSLFR